MSHRVQAVRARTSEEGRERYLELWSRWSGLLLTMGIRTELLESEEQRGAFLELTWFEEPGQEAVLADDRVTRLQAELGAAAESRKGALELLRPASGAPPGT